MPNIIEKIEVIGATQFTGLSDTPQAYVGEANKLVKVSPNEQNLVFEDRDRPESIVGKWQLGVISSSPTAGLFTTDNVDHDLIKNIMYHRLDISGSDHDSELAFIKDGDDLRIVSEIGAATYVYEVTAVTHIPNIYNFSVKRVSASLPPMQVGQNYTLYTAQQLQTGTFAGLTDTPKNYAGSSLKMVTVKTDESGLQFTSYTPAGTNLGAIDNVSAPITTPVHGDYYLADGDGDYPLIVPPVGGLTGVNDGDKLEWNKNMGAAGEWYNAGQPLASTFLNLTDTPTDYTSQKGKVPVVNTDEDALEFVDFSTGKDETVYGDWVYEAGLTAPPSSGKIKFNQTNANLPAITKMFIHDVNNNGVNERVKLLAMMVGYDYRLHQHAGANRSITFRLTGVAGHTDYVELTVKDVIPTGTISTDNLFDLDGISGGRFIELIDAPSNYTGNAGQVPIVSTAEDRLQFKQFMFTKLTDTPAGYSTAGGKVVAVKADASGLEFVTGGAGGAGTGLEKVTGIDSATAGTMPAANVFTVVGNVIASYPKDTKVRLTGSPTNPDFETTTRTGGYADPNTTIPLLDSAPSIDYLGIAPIGDAWKLVDNPSTVSGVGSINLLPTGDAKQGKMVYVDGIRYVGRTTHEILSLMGISLELGTFIFDTDLNVLLQCIDVTPGNVSWARLDRGTGFEKITEGTKSGFVLVDEDRTNHNDIGTDAFDASISTISTIDSGASGDYSNAFGNNTDASGQASFAAGAISVASATASTALCLGTKAANEGMLAAGKHNLGTDPHSIFEIGAGADTGNKANVLKVVESGAMTGEQTTNVKIDAAGGKAYITKEYFNAHSGSATHLFGDFTYNSSTTPPPPVGDIIFNNADPRLATEMHVSNVTASGKNVRGDLISMRPGSNFKLTDIADDTHNINYHMSGLDTGNATYVTFHIDHVHTNGTITTGHTFNLENIPAAAGGVSNFVELHDTPADYTGHAGKATLVKADEGGLEYKPVPEISTESSISIGIKLATVAVMPAAPDANTIYFITT